MKNRLSRLFSDPRARFSALLILQLGILGAVMLLRTALLLFQTTGIFYWKVLYQRGLPPVICGTVLCLGLTVWILAASRESVRETVRKDRGKLLIAGILLLIGAAAAVLISQTRLGLL